MTVGDNNVQLLVVIDVDQHHVVCGVNRNATDRAVDFEGAASLVQIENGSDRTAGDDHVWLFVAVHITDGDAAVGINTADCHRVVCPCSKCATAVVQQNAHPATNCVV